MCYCDPPLYYMSPILQHITKTVKNIPSWIHLGFPHSSAKIWKNENPWQKKYTINWTSPGTWVNIQFENPKLIGIQKRTVRILNMNMGIIFLKLIMTLQMHLVPNAPYFSKKLFLDIKISLSNYYVFSNLQCSRT